MKEAANVGDQRFPIRTQRLHVFTTDFEGYVAFDKYDALDAAMEWMGEKSFQRYCEDYSESVEFGQLKDWTPVHIRCAADEYRRGDFPPFPFARVECKHVGDDVFHPYYLITAPAWVWALWEGRGFLWSTEE